MNYKELQYFFQEQLQAKDKQLQELTNRIKELSDRIDYLTRQLYGGGKSEKSRPRLPKNTLATTAPISTIGACAVLEAPSVVASLSETPVIDSTPNKKAKVERLNYDHIEERIVDIPAAPHPDDAIFIGHKETVRLEYIPATIKRVIFKRPVYVKNDIFYIPQLPEMPIDKCLADSSLLSAIITNKYRYHLPLERQLTIFQSLGVDIAKSTFNSWATKSIDLLKPLTDELHKIILKSNYLNIDETILPIMLKGEDKCQKGYLWGITSNKDKLVWLYYNNGSRGKDCLCDILKNYKGAVQSDGLSTYKILDKQQYKINILRLSCLAHIRRKVFESIRTDNKGQQLFELINAIYHHEHLWQKENTERKKSNKPLLSSQQICQIRKQEEYPIMKQLYRLLQQYSKDKTILPKSTLGRAVAYALNESPGILRCLKSGEYLLDNNAIERQFKDVIVGRKNYYFCEGHKSAERTASIYSLIGCCKLNNIDPYQYLSDVLSRINGHSHKDIAQLLPQNWTPLQK